MPILREDPYGLFYTTTECPDPILGTVCITKVGGPTDNESDYMECGKTEKFLIAVLGAELSIELPVPGVIASIAYATCCECEEKFTWKEMQVREWNGRVLVDHGFFGIGQNEIIAVDFQGLGQIKHQAVNLKRHFYINCNGKRIALGSEDYSFLTADPEEFVTLPTESFNTELFDKWIIW